MQKGIFEIFEEAVKLPENQRAAFLKHNESNSLRTVLQGCYDPRLKFLLPPGAPPYQESDPIGIETRLYTMTRRFDLFVEGGRNVNQTKREMIFIETLESVHPKDATILINMKDKKDPVEGITALIAYEAFPDVFPEKPAEPVVEEKPKTPTKRTTTRKRTTTTRKKKTDT